MTVVGTRRLRREDPVLLTGEARFVDDLPVTGALHVKVVRSPFAHATIRSIDAEAAPRCPASSPCSPAPTSSTTGRRRCPARGRSPPT